jgi:hypothetical protein
MQIEVSNGELFDKISILTIKSENIEDKDKLKNIFHELEYLRKIVGSWANWHYRIPGLYVDLLNVNSALWKVEDDIRILDKKVFPLSTWECRNISTNYLPKPVVEYLELAQMVYVLNDRRSKIKKEINQLTNSNIVEEKSYQN